MHADSGQAGLIPQRCLPTDFHAPVPHYASAEYGSRPRRHLCRLYECQVGITL